MRLLAPLGALLGGAAALKAGLYRRGYLAQGRLAGRVISVGNLSIGGSGKTPVVLLVAEMLRKAELGVSILSRGYGGAFRGEALVVSDGRSIAADASLAGDEPLMLARSLEGVIVAVGPRRDVVGRAVEARFGPCVHVLDDGFQHLRLARDLDIVCVDARDLEDRPLPAGRLREFPSALGRADLVLMAGADAASAEELAPISDAVAAERVFRLSRRSEGFFSPAGEPCPAPRVAWLLHGIARPERFHADVRAYASVAGASGFPDHHPFSSGQLTDVLARARAAGADAVVTTAKDAVRLPALAADPPVLVLRIRAEIADLERFRARVLAAAADMRPGSPRATASGQARQAG